MSQQGFRSATGLALVAAGALTMIVNLVFTPQLAADAPLAQTATDPVFLWRQSLAALAALGLIFGSMGLYRAQSDRLGSFGAFAFVLACTGSALLFATEWLQLTLLRDLALHSPEAIRALDERTDLGPDALGAIAALLTFAFGWLAMAVATLRARLLPRRGPTMLIVGLFLGPLLGGVGGRWGLVIGALIPAAGWLLMGLDLRATRQSPSDLYR